MADSGCATAGSRAPVTTPWPAARILCTCTYDHGGCRMQQAGSQLRMWPGEPGAGGPSEMKHWNVIAHRPESANARPTWDRASASSSDRPLRKSRACWRPYEATTAARSRADLWSVTWRALSLSRALVRWHSPLAPLVPARSPRAPRLRSPARPSSLGQRLPAFEPRFRHSRTEAMPSRALGGFRLLRCFASSAPSRYTKLALLGSNVRQAPAAAESWPASRTVRCGQWSVQGTHLLAYVDRLMGQNPRTGRRGWSEHRTPSAGLPGWNYPPPTHGLAPLSARGDRHAMDARNYPPSRDKPSN